MTKETITMEGLIAEIEYCLSAFRQTDDPVYLDRIIEYMTQLRKSYNYSLRKPLIQK